jgi:HlyD family secretion protein
LATLELQRKRSLNTRGAVSKSHYDQMLAEHDAAAADLRAAEANEQVKISAVEAAKADLRMADANLLKARAAVVEAEAVLRGAEIDLERTVIRAPVNGVVVGRDVDRGQIVAASLEAPTLFTIAQDLHWMEVHAKIDEADIGRIRVGQRAAFTVDAFPDHNFAGTVTQIRKEPEVTENVVTYTVLVSADNPELLLLPGMTAKIEIMVDEAQAVLLIPNQALRFQPATQAFSHDGSRSGQAPGTAKDAAAGTVWILDERGQPSPVKIQTGLSDGDSSALVSGRLTEGQQLVIGVAAPPSQSSVFGLRLGL